MDYIVLGEVTATKRESEQGTESGEKTSDDNIVGRNTDCSKILCAKLHRPAMYSLSHTFPDIQIINLPWSF